MERFELEIPTQGGDVLQQQLTSESDYNSVEVDRRHPRTLEALGAVALFEL